MKKSHLLKIVYEGSTLFHSVLGIASELRGLKSLGTIPFLVGVTFKTVTADKQVFLQKLLGFTSLRLPSSFESAIADRIMSIQDNPQQIIDGRNSYTNINNLRSFFLPIKDGVFAWVEGYYNTVSADDDGSYCQLLYDKDLNDQDAKDALRNALWSGSNVLSLSSRKERATILPVSWERSQNMGSPSAEDVLNTIPHGTAYTLLLIGASGSGKSSLARKIAESRGDRILLIHRSVWGNHWATNLYQILDLLQPSVVLMEDIDMNTKSLDFLDPLTFIREAKCLTIITMMDDTLTDKKASEPGGLYYPGMRPERIDSIWYISRPDASKRRLILNTYGLSSPDFEEIVGATEGLTGTYLKSLVERMTLNPQIHWRDHLRVLRICAPICPED